LVIAIKAGVKPTQAEFHEAISARSDRWYSACLKITRDPDLAADAVQEALLNAWHKRHQFQRSARLETWIHRIAINAALGLMRQQRPSLFEVSVEGIESEVVQPYQAQQDQELQEELSMALAQLTEVERVCFVLKHLEQWRAQEIALELGINVGRVKQAVFRAVKKLRISTADVLETNI
jgi:RNA polymerase sigma-70 factor (ECF subfamily)